MMATIDEYQGKGGSYLLDPKTGKRIPAPAEHSEPALATNPKPEVTPDGASDKKDSNPDKD